MPPSFPLELADRLRANGIELRADRELFDERRRRKNATELAGLRRAQRAVEAALDVAREMLRSATVNGTLVLDGEPLTSRADQGGGRARLRRARRVADEFIVSHGAQTAIGHESGHGAILPDEPIVFDLFPRDRATGVYTDMTRTYVVGDAARRAARVPPARKEALDRVVAAAKPGVNGRDAHRRSRAISSTSTAIRRSSRRSRARCSTAASSTASATASASRCTSGRGSARVGDDLVAGDVIALEPGLYRAGYGGVRLEDIAIVTEDGLEVVTDYPYELEP